MLAAYRVVSLALERGGHAFEPQPGLESRPFSNLGKPTQLRKISPLSAKLTTLTAKMTQFIFITSLI